MIQPTARRDSAGRRCRLAVLATHPIQYYAPVFRALAEHGVVDLHVLYLSDAGGVTYHDAGFGKAVKWDIPLLDGYSHSILRPGMPIEGRRFWQMHFGGLRHRLDELRPDVILLFGYNTRMNWVAIQWAHATHRGVMYFSDSNVHHIQSGWKTWAKKPFLRCYFSMVTRFLSPSEANARYLLHFGAIEGRIRRVPFSIDVARFATNAQTPGSRRAFHFIWAGKLLPVKRPLDFIRALQLVAARCAIDVHAMLVGDGPLIEQVRNAARDLPANCQLKITGFINQRAMPSMLHSGEVFVFTSARDAYGLAATEAAAAGMALIVADGMGCIGDTVLARPGLNALVFPAGDVRTLANAMFRLITDNEMRHGMQAASVTVAREHDIPAAVQILERTVFESARHAE